MITAPPDLFSIAHPLNIDNVVVADNTVEVSYTFNVLLGDYGLVTTASMTYFSKSVAAVVVVVVGDVTGSDEEKCSTDSVCQVQGNYRSP